MIQKMLRVHSLNYLFIFTIAMSFYCTVPQDPSQDSHNVEITVITVSDGDTVTIGDSLKFRLSVLYPHLVDSIVIYEGDSVVQLLNSMSDTLSVALLPVLPGNYSLSITGYCQQNVTITTDKTFFVKSIPIEIDSQPDDITAVDKTSALFIVKASGNPAPSIQWFCDTIPLDGETGDTLIIDTVRTSMNGSRYRALLTNSVDTLWSSAAVLTILENVSRWDSALWDSAVWW